MIEHREARGADDPKRQGVHLLGQRGLLGRAPTSMSAILPTSVSPPGPGDDHHPAAVGDRGVHEGHVRLFAGTDLAAGQRRRPWPPGRSPRSTPTRRSAANWPSRSGRPPAPRHRPRSGRRRPRPAGRPGLASVPSRRTRAVAFIIDCSAFMALSALPCWRSPTTALKRSDQSRAMAVLHSAMISDTTAAPTRMSCM